MGLRQEWINKLGLIVAGRRLSSHTNDTINEVNLCAQFTRQTTEDILGIRPGTWEVAALALDFMRKAKRTVRWAVDYEAAAKELGLAKQMKDIRIGDIGFWPYEGFGHVAVYAGKINGIDYWLENTNAKSRKGGKRVYGAGTAVWLTPFSSMDVPRTLIAPTKAILNAEKAAQAPVTKIEAVMAENIGKELWLIKDGKEAEYMGKIVKASEVNDRKVYVKVDGD